MAEGQGRSSGQSVKLLHIRDYLYSHAIKEYATKEHRVTSNSIEKYLALKGIQAKRQSIYHDIETLRVDFGVPVKYDNHKHCYYLEKPTFEPYQLRLMVDSIQSSKFITQTEARDITQRIAGIADVYTKETLNRQAYVAGRVRSMNDSVVKDADKIYKAISENRKIGFRYFHYTPNPDNPKVYSKKGNLYVVSPYALLWDNGNYYLYAYLGEKKGFRTFRIDRMERITNPLDEKREGEREYKSSNVTNQEYKVFQMYHGEKMMVRVRFTNNLADAVIDQFGKSVFLTPIDGSHFVANLPVEISPPFFAWIATFGRGAKILSPDTAIEKMRDFLQKAMDMCKIDGEK